MATVTFENATRVYPGNDRPSVDSLNLEIADGEFLVLVGPSGCGKSTSLRMLAGLEDVNAGRILIGDRDVTDVQPKDRDIAMVFQNYALYPHMTVHDNMGFALKIAGTPKAEIDKRVREAAKILGLTEYLDRKPKALSGGQRQRVAMGRAIVRKPKVFLMDEPLSNLDAKLRVQTRTQIASLQRSLGVTTVYVTHDQTEALTMGDRIAVLKDGVLQQVGTPREMCGKVTIGFRPESLDVVSAQDEHSIPVRLSFVEELGSDAYIYGELVGAEDSEAKLGSGEDSSQIIVRVPPRTAPEPGETVYVRIRPGQEHIFSASTGKRLPA